MKKIFLETIKQGENAYKEVLQKNKFKHLVIDIDCSTLPKPTWKKGDHLPSELDYIFKKVPNKLPCLYYFEIVSPKTDVILKAYAHFLKKEATKPKVRRAAALKNNPPLHSKILYVGKVKYDMVGRMTVHLGYYHVEATAGLQLVCWGKDIKLKIKVHIYSFEKSMANFVSPLELPFARSLNPLIGKH